MNKYSGDAPISILRNGRMQRIEEIYIKQFENALNTIPSLSGKTINSKEFLVWKKDLSRYCNEPGLTYKKEFSKLHRVFYPAPFTIDGLLDGGGDTETSKRGIIEAKEFINAAIEHIRKQGITKSDLRDAGRIKKTSHKRVR